MAQQAEVLAIPANVSGKKVGKKPRNPKVEHVLDQTVLDGLDVLSLMVNGQTEKAAQHVANMLKETEKAKIAGRIAVKYRRTEFTMKQRFASPKATETLEALL